MKLPMEVRRSLPKVAFTKTAYHDIGGIRFRDQGATGKNNQGDGRK
jgi:hypothetical protein